MKYVALICARGGSKRLPDKNIKVLHGIPLIGRAVITAKNIKRVSRVIVSTDSKEIAETAKKYGADVPFMRPKYLAQDNSPELLSWRHALDYLNEHDTESYDALVVIPATSPLRLEVDVENCLDEYEKGKADMVVTITDSYRNPFFNMVKINDDGYSSLVNNPTGKVLNRQAAPEVYDMLTVCYVADPRYVQNNDAVFNSNKIRSVHVPVERSLDIDRPMDFIIADFLMSNSPHYPK